MVWQKKAPAVIAARWAGAVSSIERRIEKEIRDIENDPECFNPRTPFAVGKCSWSTPQCCRNAELYLGLTLPLPSEACGPMITAQIDIKPGSDRNPLNLFSQGCTAHQ